MRFERSPKRRALDRSRDTDRHRPPCTASVFLAISWVSKTNIGPIEDAAGLLAGDLRDGLRPATSGSGRTARAVSSIGKSIPSVDPRTLVVPMPSPGSGHFRYGSQSVKSSRQISRMPSQVQPPSAVVKALGEIGVVEEAADQAIVRAIALDPDAETKRVAGKEAFVRGIGARLRRYSRTSSRSCQAAAFADRRLPGDPMATLRVEPGRCLRPRHGAYGLAHRPQVPDAHVLGESRVGLGTRRGGVSGASASGRSRR